MTMWRGIPCKTDKDLVLQKNHLRNDSLVGGCWKEDLFYNYCLFYKLLLYKKTMFL